MPAGARGTPRPPFLPPESSMLAPGGTIHESGVPAPTGGQQSPRAPPATTRLGDPQGAGGSGTRRGFRCARYDWQRQDHTRRGATAAHRSQYRAGSQVHSRQIGDRSRVLASTKHEAGGTDNISNVHLVPLGSQLHDQRFSVSIVHQQASSSSHSILRVKVELVDFGMCTTARGSPADERLEHVALENRMCGRPPVRLRRSRSSPPDLRAPNHALVRGAGAPTRHPFRR